MDKKLQVFVSSTYADLIEERQAAVEAILDAGHIPAGMELFKAGNESQLGTIYRWIDESDVYMLILGGRYGSIESNSGKSYTQIEYEYALSKNIPVFAVVLSDSFLTQKITNLGLKNVTEQIAPDKYQTFKSLVMSKIIREVDDCKDIKITIHSTLNEFINEYDLIGWVRNSNENDIIQLLKNYANVLEENNSLNKQIEKLQEQINVKKEFGNYTFQELYDKLKKKYFIVNQEKVSALNCFTNLYKHSSSNRDIINSYYNIFHSSEKLYNLDEDIFDYLYAYELVEIYEIKKEINKGNIFIDMKNTYIYQTQLVSKTGLLFYSLLVDHDYI